MNGSGRHEAWADDTNGLDDADESVYNDATRSYNTSSDAGWSERLEVERGAARYRLNKDHGFIGYIVRTTSCHIAPMLVVKPLP